MPAHVHRSPFEHCGGVGGETYGLMQNGVYAGATALQVAHAQMKTYVQSTGESSEHSVMPSYQNIYVWRKIEDPIN